MEYVLNIFSRSLKKTRENWDKLSVHFSIFEWWNWPKHQFCQIAKCQMAFFGITVNFIIQRLKSKHLVCLSFLWWQVFLREREKIFFTHSGPKNTKSAPFFILFFFGSFCSLMSNNVVQNLDKSYPVHAATCPTSGVSIDQSQQKRKHATVCWAGFRYNSRFRLKTTTASKIL